MKRDKYDSIFSNVIREAANWTCELCGIQKEPTNMGGHSGMECSHDISRRFVITRYDPRNAICSCSQCHYKTTNNPHEHHRAFVSAKGAEEVKLNEERAHSGLRLKKWEKDDIYSHYKEELKRIKKERMNGNLAKLEIEIPEALL